MFSFVLSFAGEIESLHLGVWITLDTVTLHVRYLHSWSECVKIDCYYHYNCYL